MLCGWDLGLLLQITLGRTGSSRPLHRGDGSGAGKDGVTIGDREPETESTQHGDSMGEKEAMLTRV